MKQLIILILGLTLFVSCKSTRPITDQFPEEKYTAFEITREQAAEYEKAYQSDADFKKRFRDGMYLPVHIIDELRKQSNCQGFAVYYGKHPEFSSPVFIIYVTSTTESNRQAKASEGEGKVYLAYYPCPTLCGK